MKTGRQLLIAMACALLATGCNRDAEPQAAAAPEPAPATARDLPAATSPPAETPFMAKAFAGTFSAGGNSILLNADGTYASQMGDVTSDGTWTADPMGTELLLDPNSKSETDGRYTVVSRDEISAVDGGLRLQREGAAR